MPIKLDPETIYTIDDLRAALGDDDARRVLALAGGPLARAALGASILAALGGRPMTSRANRFRVGCVLVRVSRGRWVAQWRAGDGRYLRRVLPATDAQQARQMAAVISSQVAAGRGLLAPAHRPPTVEQAIDAAIAQSLARPRTRAQYRSRSRPFVEFCSARGVQTWDRVDGETLAAYRAHCIAAGCAPDSLRLRFSVVKSTLAHWARLHPDRYRDLSPLLRLRGGGAPAGPEGRILTPGQARALVEWLSTYRPMVACWAALAAFAGLRVFEAAYLRREDVDMDGGTVAVVESPAHAPKTAHSRRVVPVSPAALAPLRAWVATHDGEGYLFTAGRRRPGARPRLAEVAAGALSMDAVCHLWRQALDDARRDGVELPQAFTPRRLRASFVSALRAAGADVETLGRYIGHRPASIIGRHYDAPDAARLRRVAQMSQAVFGRGWGEGHGLAA